MINYIHQLKIGTMWADLYLHKESNKHFMLFNVYMNEID